MSKSSKTSKSRASKSPLPEGWHEEMLGNLVPDDVIEQIVTSYNAGSLSVQRIKDLLAPHREELERKGVVDTYLAYVLALKLGVAL